MPHFWTIDYIIQCTKLLRIAIMRQDLLAEAGRLRSIRINLMGSD